MTYVRQPLGCLPQDRGGTVDARWSKWLRCSYAGDAGTPHPASGHTYSSAAGAKFTASTELPVGNGLPQTQTPPGLAETILSVPAQQNDQSGKKDQPQQAPAPRPTAHLDLPIPSLTPVSRWSIGACQLCRRLKTDGVDLPRVCRGAAWGLANALMALPEWRATSPALLPTCHRLVGQDE